MARDLYKFGPFQLDPGGRRLLRDGELVSITPKAFDTLTTLLLQKGQVIAREELLAQIWPDTTVGEYSLNQCIAVLRKVLDDNSRQPTYIATLPGRGYSFVAEVSKLTVANGSETQHEPGDATTLMPTRVDGRSRNGLAVALALVVAGFCLWYLTHLRSASAMHKVKPRPSVAVLPMKNLARRPDAAWLSTALPEMLSTELETGGELRVIPVEAVAPLQNGQRPTSGAVAESPRQLGQQLGSDFLISGAYTVLPAAAGNEQVRIDLTVRRATSGETVASMSQEGSIEELFMLLSRSGAELRHDLGAGPASAASDQEARATVPSNTEAGRFYAAGVEKLRAVDPEQARQLLEQAVAVDPSFPLAHLALADAWHLLGYQSNEAAEAKRAWELSTSLSRENQLRLEARYAQTEPDWSKAIADYRSLATFFPDNLDYGLGLVNALIGAGKAQDALTTIDALRKLPLQDLDRARLDLAEATSRGTLSDYKQAAIAADHAAQAAESLQLNWLATRALLYEAGAWGSAADEAHAAPVRARVLTLCEAYRDRPCMAVIYRWRGIEKVGSDLDESERAFRSALAIAKEIGSRGEEENDLNGLAAVANGRGDYRTADRMYEALLASARQRDNKWSIQMAANNLGADLFFEGRLPEARREEEEALAVSRESGQKVGIADALVVLAHILEMQGDLQGAKNDYEEALSTYHSLGSDGSGANAESGLGDILRDRNDLAGARSKHENALKYFSQSGDTADAALEELAIARLNFDEQRFDETLQAARKASEDLGNLRRYDDEALGQILLAEAFVSLGRGEEARVAATHAEDMISHSQGQLVRLQVRMGEEIVRAIFVRGRGGAGKARDVIPEASHLLAIARDARTQGLMRLELEARLAEATLARSSPHPALAEVQRDAMQHGFLLIASRAAAIDHAHGRSR